MIERNRCLMATTRGEVSNAFADLVSVYGAETAIHAVTES